MGSISAPQVKDTERSRVAFEQLSDSSREFPVKHEVVADDLLIGGPGFAENVDRVCVQIENVLPFGVNSYMRRCMTEAVTAPYANLRERPSTRFGSMVESGKQPGQQFAEFVPAITAITGKWHEQFSKNQIFTASDLSTPFLTSQNADCKNIN
jgi:hypothetical protein